MRYTSLNKIGLLISFLGLLLFPFSIYLQIAETDIFLSQIWISIVLFISGGIFTFIDSGLQRDSKTTRISSNLTLFYKVIFSIMLLGVLMFLICMVIYSMIAKSEMILFWIIFTIIASGLFLITGKTLLRLNFVEYDKDNLIASNFNKISKIRFDNIIDISRFQLYFYRIKIKDDTAIKKIYFMPIIGEVFSTFMIGKPESIKKLMKKINKKV